MAAFFVVVKHRERAAGDITKRRSKVSNEKFSGVPGNKDGERDPLGGLQGVG